jgi:hypothetical protein
MRLPRQPIAFESDRPDDYDPAKHSRCACGRQFNGSDASGGHCTSGCHENFNSLTAFDRHRVGKFDPDERRCLTTAEMLAKGWTPSGEFGAWRLPAPASNPWKKQEER